MNEKQVAIIILNYNSWRDTQKEVLLCREKLNVSYEDIIVVDNASPNNSGEMLREQAGKLGFIMLESQFNNGYASGNNIGLRYAFNNGYKYALVLNNDIIIDDELLLDKLMAVFQKDKSIAVVNPDIYSPEGYMFNRDARKMSFYYYTIGAVKYKKIGRIAEDLGGYAIIYRPQGCCMMVDLNKIDEIDYMDENTFLYYEEVILAERLLKKQYKCALSLESKIIHNHSTTVKSVLDKRQIQKIANKSFRYYLSEYRKFNIIQINICCMFSNIKSILTELKCK